MPRFKTEKERADATLKELDEFDKKYGSSSTARRGQAVPRRRLLRPGPPRRRGAAYEKFIKGAHPSPLLLAAQEGLGLCREQQDKLDDALAHYQALEPKTGDFYRDRALWDQARVLTKKGDKKKARRALKELVAKTPSSPLKDEAQTQIAQLEGT